MYSLHSIISRHIDPIMFGWIVTGGAHSFEYSTFQRAIKCVTLAASKSGTMPTRPRAWIALPPSAFPRYLSDALFDPHQPMMANSGCERLSMLYRLLTRIPRTTILIGIDGSRIQDVISSAYDVIVVEYCRPMCTRWLHEIRKFKHFCS